METKKYQLPRDFATNWLEALRKADESTHHTGELRSLVNPDCYCAIGVACVANDIEISDNGLMMVIDGKIVDYYTQFHFKGQKLAYDIVDLNDIQGKAFSEIADWIEQNVELI